MTEQNADSEVICGVAGTGVAHCSATDSGGARCENFEPHGPMSGHFVTQHTIEHTLAGNGYACSAISTRPGEHVFGTVAPPTDASPSRCVDCNEEWSRDHRCRPAPTTGREADDE